MMQLIIIFFLFTYTLGADTDGEYTIPLFPKIKPIELTSKDEHDLGRDPYSGCSCHQSPKKWIVCFGAETCHHFPKNQTAKEKVFKLRSTNIKTIKKGDLINLHHLVYLEIEANDKLVHIEGGTFQGLSNLRNLSISHNLNFSTIDANLFEGLINLEELVLVKNNFHSIHSLALAVTPKYLPQLRKLSLNENVLRQILKDDFYPMEGTKVSELSLVLCSLDFIHPEALLTFKHLVSLKIGQNIFNNSIVSDLISSMVENGIPLKRLNLYGVGFRRMPPLDLMKSIAKSNITHLNLANNQFEQLTMESFPPMPNLIWLDLQSVYAISVDGDAFGNFPKLDTLLLSGNKISGLQDGILLPNLKYLDLSSNSGTVWNPSYFSLGKDKFVNMTHLWGLNLNFNNLRNLFNYSFVGLEGLKVLGLRNATVLTLGKCSFCPLKSLIFLDLENNEFRTPLGNETFKGLENLEVLLLGGCSIEYIDIKNNPFRRLIALKHLSLERNGLKTIEPWLFIPLVNLKHINVGINFITSWQTRLFSKNSITRINAKHNKVTHITKAMIEDFSEASHLDLSQNPFICDCPLVTIIKNTYTTNNRSLLSMIMKNPTYCVYPEEFSNYTLRDYYSAALENNFCPWMTAYPNVSYFIYFTVTSLVMLLIVILGYKLRFYIRYWYSLTKIELIRRGRSRAKRRKNTNRVYTYDAFISYSSEDKNFVNILIDKLENEEPYLKLCCYERDFQIGSIITEKIYESVAKSRKTLLIVSNAYIKSQWCRWEAQVAEHHRLFFEDEDGDLVNDSIVIIKLEDVAKTRMPWMLKYLLKTRIYLQYEKEAHKEKSFWEKLKKILAPPGGIEETRC